MSDKSLQPPASYLKARNNYYLRNLRWKLAVCVTMSQKSEQWREWVNELFIEPIKQGNGASHMRTLSEQLSAGPLSLDCPRAEIDTSNPEDSFFDAYEILLRNPVAVGKLPTHEDIKDLALRIWAQANLIKRGVPIANVFQTNKQEAALKREVAKLKSKVPWRIWETMGLQKPHQKSRKNVSR
jgi:hypothetical protein